MFNWILCAIKNSKDSFPSISITWSGFSVLPICYHYNKLSVISLSYEHGSGANVFTNILQAFLFRLQEETVYITLKNRSSLLSASEAVTTPVMVAHHCIWVPGWATCRTKPVMITRTLVQIMLVLKLQANGLNNSQQLLEMSGVFCAFSTHISINFVKIIKLPTLLAQQCW